MFEELIKELSSLDQVEAIALGGSRAQAHFDDTSDYDVYLYITDSIDEKIRKDILSKYCNYIEIGNHFWELEDNVTLNNGIDMDILYRNLDDFSKDVESVVEKHIARNAYTTCMWHNLKTCKILYDQNGRLTNVKNRFDVAYPKELKENILHQNMHLLKDVMPAYQYQIAKSVKRMDLISIQHRTTAFLETYFDILFALNEKTHPGEKRLISLCLEQCEILPNNFEKNLTDLLKNLYTQPEVALQIMYTIIEELEKVL